MFYKILIRLRRLRELGVVGLARRLSTRGRRFVFYHRFKRKALAGSAASSWAGVAARHRLPSDFACFWQEVQASKSFENLIDHPRLCSFRPPEFGDPAALRARADQIVGNVFEVFGSGPVAFDSVPWLFDFTLPRSLWGTEYWNQPRLQFFMDLVARQPAAADPAARAPDIKVPWELSRFHHLVVLGLAYRRSGDVAYARAFEAQVASWFAANPFLLGVNWVCPMDVGLRVVNLLWAAMLFKDAPTLSTDFWRSVVCSIYDHLFYLSNTWETSDKPNNHYLADLVGYLYGAAFFKKIEYFDKKFEKTLAEFEKQVRHQCGGEVTLRDGAGHLLPAFAQAVVALAKTSSPLRRAGRESGGGGLSQPGLPEERTLQAYASRGGDGVSYEGSTAYHRLDTEMVLHVVCLCESLGRAVPPALPPIFEKMVTFLQDCSDQGGFLIKVGDDDSGKVVTGLADRPSGDRRLVTYQSFGLTIVKQAGWHLTYRHPTFARHQPSGHFHHDELAITLSIDGRLIFGDPGSYLYTASRYWRDAFRSASAHNTFFIETFEQFSSDLFQLDRRPHDQVPVVTTDGGVTTITDFHRRYADRGVTCWRSVSFEAAVQKLTVTDWLTGGTAATTWSFHGAPGITFRSSADGLWVIAHEKAGDLATLTSTLPLTCQPDFYAPAYGVLVPTQTLTATVAAPVGRQVTVVRRLG